MVQKTKEYQKYENYIIKGKHDVEFQVSDEFKKALAYFRILKCRNDISVCPNKKNGYELPILELQERKHSITVVSYPKLLAAMRKNGIEEIKIQLILKECMEV